MNSVHLNFFLSQDYYMLYKKLILSGGGIKGISFIGALHVLQLYNILSHIDTFVGCSAGAIVALLISIGYTPKQLYQLFIKINFNNYHDIQFEQFLNHKGLDSGTKIMKLISIICNRKGLTPTTTFHELWQKTNKTLIIVGSNITTNRVSYFNHLTAPTMPVLTAIRISISYPYIFTPVMWNGGLHVDGGLLDPFPIKYFGVDCLDVIGILIHDKLHREDRNNCNDTIEDYSLSILSAIIDKITEASCEGMHGRFIQIDIKDVHSMNFQQGDKDKYAIYQQGVNKTHAFFKKYYLMRKYFRIWKYRTFSSKKITEYPVCHPPYSANTSCP